MDFLKNKDEHDMKIVKIVLVTAGAVLAVAAAALVVYKIVKKHFKITLECGDDDYEFDDSALDDDDYTPSFLDEDEDEDALEEMKKAASDAAEKAANAASDALDGAEEAVDDIFADLDKDGE